MDLVPNRCDPLRGSLPAPGHAHSDASPVLDRSVPAHYPVVGVGELTASPEPRAAEIAPQAPLIQTEPGRRR
jgi:hypothetical protein